MAERILFKKAVKVKLTAGRIEAFECPEDKAQVFLWSNDPAGLAIRATLNGAKSYIFQSKINGKSMRLTIGATQTWTIYEAQAEARRLQVLIDKGLDPRQVKAEQEATQKESALSQKLQQTRETVTLALAWDIYIEERKSRWSDSSYRDHIKSIHLGGAIRKRSNKKTVPGTLASLANIRLVDLTSEKIEEWADVEVKKRPARARLSLALLKAFLFWCMRHPVYKLIVLTNVAKNKTAKEKLGKPNVKNDVLQREQLPVWFEAVKQIPNPVISAYLQVLLLTGARREELARLRWHEVDFRWNSLTIKDKVEGQRVIPLTPYIQYLLSGLPRSNEWVFSSSTGATGRLMAPHYAHNKACDIAGLYMTLHGLRRSFATLSEWVEVPGGISAQIMGHKPQGVREQNYIRRPLDLLRKWHIKIEEWILEEAGVKFVPIAQGLRLAK